MEDSAGEKEFAPSQRRLEEARIKGEGPMGRDLLAAGALAGLVLAGYLWSGNLLALASSSMVLLDQADRLAPLFSSDGAAAMVGFFARVVLLMLPFMLLPAVMVILAAVAQNGLVWAPARLVPKWSNISPLAGMKRKFGRNGLFEFAKSFVKLLCVSGVLALFLGLHAEEILSSLHAAPGQVMARLMHLLLRFMLLVLGLQFVIGMIDLLWQRAEHLRRNRMSRKEMMDELKNSEGDPHMRAHRRRKAEEVANNRMLADVATADVVIVNPTHYAVALRWNRSSRHAPICVAKGVDEIAARIRERAQAAGIPLRRDPPTARALHATVELGKEIHPEHFRAVAAAIRFSEAMRLRARGGARERSDD